MSLQGTLDTFAVADVVRLLANTTKTGQLSIDGDRGAGHLWFDEGSLVAGEPAADGTIVDAVTNLLRFGSGNFLFETDARPAQPGAPESAEEVLSAAEERAEVWRQVEGVVPSPEVSVHLREDLDTDDATVTRDQWRQLVTIAGGTSARRFGSDLGLDDLAAAVAIKGLVDAGFASVGEGTGPGPGSIPAHAPSDTVGEVGDAPVLTLAPAPADMVSDMGSDTATDTMPDPTPDPVSDAPVEPRPSLRALVRDVASTRVEEPAGSVEPAPAPVEPELPGPGSTDVTIDAQLGADEAHSYLAAGTDTTALLPEPLLDETSGEWIQGDTDALAAQIGSPSSADPGASAAQDDESQSALRKIITNGRT